MIKTRPRGRNKPLFRTCKQSQPVQSHAKTALGVNVKILSDITVADARITSLGVNGPLPHFIYRNLILRSFGRFWHNIGLAPPPRRLAPPRGIMDVPLHLH